MAPPADMEKRGVGRLVERGQTRIARRAQHTQSRTVLRLGDRAGDGLLTRAPDEVEMIARSGGALPAHRAADMRSRIVRRVVEMQVLDAKQGLARKAAEQVQRAAAGGDDGDKGKGTATVFEEWYAQLTAQGLTEREIEEHLAARVRSVRRGLALMYRERLVGRH